MQIDLPQIYDQKILFHPEYKSTYPEEQQTVIKNKILKPLSEIKGVEKGDIDFMLDESFVICLYFEQNSNLSALYLQINPFKIFSPFDKKNFREKKNKNFSCFFTKKEEHNLCEAKKFSNISNLFKFINKQING